MIIENKNIDNTTKTACIYLIPTILAENTEKNVLTPQIKEIVTNIDDFFVEELRTARRFVSSLKTGKIIENLNFYEFNKKTSISEIEIPLKRIKSGFSAGIISEAGCPGIADPGAVLVAWAHTQGIRVVPLVGASAIFMALMASGMNGQNFAFSGYLPIDKKDRAKGVAQLENIAYTQSQTQIFMETPFRNNHLLETILQTCQPNTLLCIACNITAQDEFIQTKPIKEWKKIKLDLHKKPTVFLIGK